MGRPWLAGNPGLRRVAAGCLRFERQLEGPVECGDNLRGTQSRGVKDYLLDHTGSLARTSGEIRASAEDYYSMAKQTNFDHGELLKTKRADVQEFVETSKRLFAKANPEYEQMEGVVAGVPELAEYDVIIDAGSDATDPQNAVPFDIKTPDGRTFRQPGNLNYLIETSVFGTEQKFAAKGVEPDLDGDGKVEFGEAVPDANFYLAAAREFERQAKALDAASKKWQPSRQDAFTALVVMTPTMSEYFEAWKNSRFIAGDQAKEKAFVVSSRLQDIGDILGGLVLVYDSIQADVAKVNRGTSRADRQVVTGTSEVRREPREQGEGRPQVLGRGSRHAWCRSTEPRRGDRRTDLAGRRPAQYRSPGGLTDAYANGLRVACSRL